jgi:hypothetical protein
LNNWLKKRKRLTGKDNQGKWKVKKGSPAGCFFNMKMEQRLLWAELRVPLVKPDFYSAREQKRAATHANNGLCGLSTLSQICSVKPHFLA